MDYTAKKHEKVDKVTELEGLKQQLLSNVNNITIEQAKLQGEIRLLEELGAPTEEKQPDVAEVAPEATPEA